MSTQAFQEWINTPQGQYVVRWEKSRVDQLVSDIFGFNAIQIGMPRVDYLEANRMPFRCAVDAEGTRDLQAHPHHLPFAADSVDLLVLPHVLEFDANPHQILREAARVLVPEGHVLITGFNPFSLWGACRQVRKRRAPAPWHGDFISVPRLKDWFSLLEMEMQSGCFGRYAPAFTQEKWLHRAHFMEFAGDRWWPFAGAVYVIEAVKRVYGMRLLMPAWRDRLLRAKRLVPIVQKNDQ